MSLNPFRTPQKVRPRFLRQRQALGKVDAKRALESADGVGTGGAFWGLNLVYIVNEVIPCPFIASMIESPWHRLG